ncbi:Sleepless protein [Popillia japonica]|uniref:Sleepless protein n=1 Tax=Popillia japonica TaxID=7064 RepID=A0AAW1LSM9_POPJA
MQKCGAIRCYTCESAGGGQCYHPDQPLTVTNCTIPAPDLSSNTKPLIEFSCSSYEFATSNGTQIEKSCIDNNLKDSYCSLVTAATKATKFRIKHCYVCSTDLCNLKNSPALKCKVLVRILVVLYLVTRFL